MRSSSSPTTRRMTTRRLLANLNLLSIHATQPRVFRKTTSFVAKHMNVPLPTRGHYYRPELDVLRFIAFALVFLYHSVPAISHPKLASLIPTLTPVLLTFAASGRYGVSVFFVLSAFLLCELLLREKQATGSIRVGQFYIRRVARIWPLYYLILALGILFAMIPGNPSGGMNQIGWYAIF